MSVDPPITGPFRAGALVIVTLGNPREKFWGAILHLSPEGVSLRGVDLVAFEDLVSQIRAGDPFTSGVVFFPMHRVQRIEEDDRNGDLPSLADQFRSKTGVDVLRLFGEPQS